LKEYVIEERDFSNLSRFPGETGNLFDIILHRLEAIDRIPWPVFALILAALAGIVSWFEPVHWAILGSFYLLDWLMLVMLPRAGVSFGPPKPPALFLAILRSVFFFLPLPFFVIAQVIGTLLVIDSFWIEPRRLTITHQKLETNKIQPGHSIRVLHIGDIHVERKSAREKKLNEAVRGLSPDVILFSGDILNLSYLHDPISWQDARSVISEWQAPLGVYMVTGSPAVDLPEIMPDLVKDLSIRWLRDEKISIDCNGATIELVGVTCTHRPHLDGEKLALLVPASPDRFTILLYHSPDLAPVAARLGIDLQLSGHTHGGQFRLPFLGALFTGSLYGRALQAGRIKIKDLTLYITRGIGLEGAAAPRLRFLCPPEIILWEITAGNPAEKTIS